LLREHVAQKIAKAACTWRCTGAGRTGLRLTAGELAQQIFKSTHARSATALWRRGLRIGTAEQLPEQIAKASSGLGLRLLRWRSSAADQRFENTLRIHDAHSC
jgi:hypothetical protein